MSKGVLDGIFFHPDCPAWANYAAVDKNGEVWFFELEPVPGADGTWNNIDSRSVIVPDCCYLTIDWQNSLVQRPGLAALEIEMSMLLDRKERRIQELEKQLLDKNISTLDPQKEKLFALLLIELEKAEQKHPEFPDGFSEASAIVTEEYLELIRAINDQESVDRVVEEASHVAVTALRLIGTVLAE